MPRFYFELCDGAHFPDEEGQEFPTLKDAHEEAVKSARSIMRDEILRGTLPLGDRIRILDETRAEVEIVHFRDVVRIQE